MTANASSGETDAKRLENEVRKLENEKKMLLLQKYSKPIDRFSGSYDQDIERWLLDLDKRADYFDWTEIKRVLVLRGSLVGTAGLFLSLVNDEEMISYDKLRLALLKEFCVEPGSSTLKKLIEKKIQLELERELLLKERDDLIRDLETQDVEHKSVDSMVEKGDEPEVEIRQQCATEDQNAEENHELNKKCYDESESKNKMVETKRCLGNIEHNEVPETEESGEGVKAVGEQKTGEARLKIGNYQIEPEKIQSLRGLNLEVVLILKYIATRWTNTLNVDAISPVKYEDTGWMDVSGPVMYADTGWRKFEDYNTNELIEGDQRSGWPSC